MKKRINAGGNIFKTKDGQPGTIRINRVDVEPTVQWLETITGLELTDYKTLLQNCELILGNSSSGIHEAATFKKPVVNIGSRQQGRLKGRNIIDVGNNYREITNGIKKGLSKTFKQKIKNIINPYGSGGSSKKIVKIIKSLKVKKIKTQKVNAY